MSEIKFACFTLNEVPILIPIEPGDAKPVIIKALGIVLEDQEDILIMDQASGSIVSSTSLYELISSLRLPTDLKFFVQKVQLVPDVDVLMNPLNVLLEPTSNNNGSMEPQEISEDLEIPASPPANTPITGEVFHFGEVEKLASFLNQNLPGLIQTSENTALTNVERVNVSKEIIENILDQFPSFILQKPHFLSLSNAITSVFKAETSCTYFVPYGESGKTTPTGKLYQQYVQYRKKLASRNVITVRERKKRPIDGTSNTTPIQLDTDSSETAALRILNNEVDVNDPKVINAWKVLFNYRQKRLASEIPTNTLLEDFPILTQKESYKLALIDFEQIIGKQIKIEFPAEFSDKVTSKISKVKLKSPSVSEVLKKLNQAKTDNNKDYENLLALHLLAYQFDCVNDSHGNKLSKVEIADSFIQIRDDFTGIKSFDAPCLAVVGYPPMIVVDIIGKKSYFSDLKLGLEAFIAFHFSFNIEYMKEAKAVWYFAQYYLFRVLPDADRMKKGLNKTLAKDLGIII